MDRFNIEEALANRFTIINITQHIDFIGVGRIPLEPNIIPGINKVDNRFYIYVALLILSRFSPYSFGNAIGWMRLKFILMGLNESF